jgi:hypothetical protein
MPYMYAREGSVEAHDPDCFGRNNLVEGLAIGT